ncbi:MAG: hypothetical protein MR332_04745 [Fusicatenibacter sp.]|nr:hypothetical protein [Fusicatenibacter sp.]
MRKLSFPGKHREHTKEDLQKKPQNKIALKGGSYSLVITGIVLAILIVVYIFASVLPKTMTQYDISATKLYSITSSTKVRGRRDHLSD